MKKLVLVGLLFLGLNCLGQGTTQKEFNYVTKGYKEDLSNGRDIIAGYTIEPGVSANSSMNDNGKIVGRTSKLYRLIRNDTKVVAAFIIEEKRNDNGNIVYVCLPNSFSDAKMWEQAQNLYYKKIQDYKCDQSDQAYSYSWNILQMLSISFTKL